MNKFQSEPASQSSTKSSAESSAESSTELRTGPSPQSSTEVGAESMPRILLGVIAPLVTLATVSLPILMTRSGLPDPMNISWGSDGVANNPTSPVDFLGYNLAVGGVCAVLFVVAALRLLPTAMANATAALVAAVVAPVFAVISLQVSLANRSVDIWTDAPAPSKWWLVAVVGASFLGAVAVSFPLKRLFKMEPIDPSNRPSAGLTLDDTQAVLWHSQATSSWWRVSGLALVPLGLVVVGVGVWIGVFLSGAGLFLLGIGLLFIILSHIDVSVDQTGLTIRYGPFPWPRNHIKLASIVSAEAIYVKPLEHGGWGYRGSRKLFGMAAVVVRSGPGIRLALTDGNSFVVTVDNAEQGAGVLNDLRSGV